MRANTKPRRSPHELAMADLHRSAASGRRRSLQQARERVTNASQHLRDGATYDGAELRAFEGRPGAMDAYGLPSLISGQRVWRRQK
jgi:hypothetical protein